jgi:hypothetical protein
MGLKYALKFIEEYGVGGRSWISLYKYNSSMRETSEKLPFLRFIRLHIPI